MTDPSEFERRLAEFERSGGNLLVVGESTEAHADLSRRLFGENAHRVLALVGPIVDGADRFGPDYDRVREVRLRCGTRSVAGSEGDAGAGTGGENGDREASDRTTRRVVDDLPAFGTAITEEVATADALAGEGESVRVGVDSVGSVVETAGREGAVGFLHVLSRAVADHDALAHYHLAGRRGDEHCAFLRSLFDGVVEVRRDGGPEHRWQLGDVETDWLSAADL